MDKLYKQAQRMQAELTLAQEELEKTVFEGASGGGMVKAKVNGQGDVLAVSVSPEVVDPNDVEMLEDMIISAIKEAMRLSREASAKRMNSLTGGFGGFPGLM